MVEEEYEEKLDGGNVNNSVVKVGNTVRRSIGKFSKNVHALLSHLEDADFPNAPRFLGIDSQGREILSYFEGTSDFPEQIWTGTQVLSVAARLLRDYHDATVDFVADHKDFEAWAYSYPDTKQHEVICHNDFAPYNLIFCDGKPIGIIDFDLAGPGPRLRDLAYLTYWTVPLSFSAPNMAQLSLDQIAKGSPRLKLICEAYGTSDVENLLQKVSEVLHHMGDEQQAVKMIGAEAAGRLKDGGHFLHWQREANHYDKNRSRLIRSLQSLPKTLDDDARNLS